MIWNSYIQFKAYWDGLLLFEWLAYNTYLIVTYLWGFFFRMGACMCLEEYPRLTGSERTVYREYGWPPPHYRKSAGRRSRLVWIQRPWKRLHTSPHFYLCNSLRSCLDTAKTSFPKAYTKTSDAVWWNYSCCNIVLKIPV